MPPVKSTQLLDIFDRFRSELDLKHSRDSLLCTWVTFVVHYTTRFA
jgi:hypothetical protein